MNKCSRAQREFLSTFDIDSNKLKTSQIFQTIHWIKTKDPTAEQLEKLKRRIAEGESTDKA